MNSGAEQSTKEKVCDRGARVPGTGTRGRALHREYVRSYQYVLAATLENSAPNYCSQELPALHLRQRRYKF
jgi:hypothetical protein